MHLTDNLVQFGARSQKFIDLLDLVQDEIGLLADRLPARRADPRESARILPRRRGKHRPNRCREDATTPVLKKHSGPSVTRASAGLVCVAQANRNIDRDDIETDNDIRESAHLPNARSVRLDDHGRPTTRGAVHACDASHLSPLWRSTHRTDRPASNCAWIGQGGHRPASRRSFLSGSMFQGDDVG